MLNALSPNSRVGVTVSDPEGQTPNQCLVSPGGGGDPLKPGEKIRETESGLDLEELVSQYVHGNVGDKNK